MPRRRPGPPQAEEARRALGDRRARPNVAWIAALAARAPDEVRSVLRELDEVAPYDVEIRRRHLAAGRKNYAQFRAPLDLYALVRLLRPTHVVETGVSSGVSSAHLLLALRRNRSGQLHSIDQPKRQRAAVLARRESIVSLPPGAATGWAVPDALKERWDLRLGPSQRLLPSLVARLPEVGLFLHDSLHTPLHLSFELETVRPKLGPGAVVLADNTIWTGAAFPRFARSLGTPMRRRGRSDLVGLRVPA